MSYDKLSDYTAQVKKRLGIKRIPHGFGPWVEIDHLVGVAPNKCASAIRQQLKKDRRYGR